MHLPGNMTQRGRANCTPGEVWKDEGHFTSKEEGKGHSSGAYSLSKGLEPLKFTACLEKVCGPCETGTRVCHETGQGELGPTRMGQGVRRFLLFSISLYPYSSFYPGHMVEVQ